MACRNLAMISSSERGVLLAEVLARGVSEPRDSFAAFFATAGVEAVVGGAVVTLPAAGAAGEPLRPAKYPPAKPTDNMHAPTTSGRTPVEDMAAE